MEVREDWDRRAKEVDELTELDLERQTFAATAERDPMDFFEKLKESGIDAAIKHTAATAPGPHGERGSTAARNDSLGEKDDTVMEDALAALLNIANTDAERLGLGELGMMGSIS